MSRYADKAAHLPTTGEEAHGAEFIIRNETMFGPAIQEFRHRTAVSQADLAETLDLHRSYLSALENGRANSAMRAIMRAYRELGLEVVVRPRSP